MANAPPPNVIVRGVLQIAPLLALIAVVVMMKPWKDSLEDHEMALLGIIVGYFAKHLEQVFNFQFGQRPDGNGD